MSLAQNLKLSLPKNRMSEDAVLLTARSTPEYNKRREGQPPQTYGSLVMTVLNFEQVTFFLSHPLQRFLRNFHCLTVASLNSDQ